MLMIFALDFDRTLFDTDRDFASIEERGLTALIGDPSIHEVVDPVPFLYPDAIPFLQRQNKQKIFIVSAITPEYGPLSDAYQKDKIERCGMREYVEDIFLVVGSKVPALKIIMERHPDETIIFVDDRSDVIVAVTDELPEVVCVHIVREGAKIMSDVELPLGVEEARTLAELEKLAKRYA